MATSWEKKRLGDLAIIIMGQSPKSEYYNNRGVGLPFFQGNRDFGELHPSPSTYCSLPSKIALPKDILMSVRAPVGALNIATEECCIGRGLCAIRPNRSERFIFYLLKANIENIRATESGAVFGAVNKADLNNLLLVVPSDEQTQDKIAAILSAYDDLIENNLRRIKILEEMAQSIYREWFVKFRFPGHHKVKMVDSPLGKIPEGWEVSTLGSLADITWGDTSVTKESYVSKGYDAYSASGLDGKLEYFHYERDGIVLSAIGANCGETWFAKGKWSCIKNTIRFWAISQTVSTEYLFFATKGKNFWPKRGSAQPFISQGDARACVILVPSAMLMKSFSSFANYALAEIDLLTKKNAILRQTRDLLLPKLISGELDVSDLDVKTGINSPSPLAGEGWDGGNE